MHYQRKECIARECQERDGSNRQGSAKACAATAAVTADSLHHYLRQIGQHALLTREQEQLYATAAQRGNQEAIHCMIRHNLRLVVRIARDYQYRGLTLMELVSEGHMGLIRAAEKFDPAFGCKFSNYAGLWIRQAIDRALIRHGQAVRIPYATAKALHKLICVRQQLMQTLGRWVSVVELAQHMGVSADEVRALLVYEGWDLSLHVCIGEFGTDSLQDRLVCESAVSPCVEYADAQLRQVVCTAVRQLPERQRRVLSKRFGLFGHAECSVAEVARRLELSRAAVQHSEQEGLHSLRQTLRLYQLDGSNLFSG